MAARIRAHDWARPPLGPRENWPAPLRVAVDLCVDSALASAVWWGPELVTLYNDACLPLYRDRHPGILGRPAHQAWPDSWPVVAPLVEQILATGQPVRLENTLRLV